MSDGYEAMNETLCQHSTRLGPHTIFIGVTEMVDKCNWQNM